MNEKSVDDLDRVAVLCEVLADSFVDASEQEIDQAISDQGLDVEALLANTSRAIDNALSQSLKKKLQEAGKVARQASTTHRPDLSTLTREELIEKLRTITANEDNAGEMLTMAARAGRGSLPVEELRSLIEDFYSISTPGAGDD